MVGLEPHESMDVTCLVSAVQAGERWYSGVKNVFFACFGPVLSVIYLNPTACLRIVADPVPQFYLPSNDYVIKHDDAL